MLDISRQLLHELNRCGIRYLHWKGNYHFKDGLNGTGDIDLLVHRDDESPAKRILTNINFINAKTQRYRTHDHVEDLIGLDEPSGKLIHLHLHFEAVFGRELVDEYTFVPYDLCFEESLLEDGCQIQNPVLEYLLLLCRIKTGDITDPHKIAANRSYLTETITNEEFYRIMNKLGLTENKIRLLRQTMLDDTIDMRLLHDTINQWMKQNIRHAALESFRRKLIFYYAQRVKGRSLSFFSKKALPNSGLLIAFIGQDGAGKSTVTDDTVQWLTWKLEARKFYLGNGEHYHSWQKSLRLKMPRNNPLCKMIAGMLAVSDLKALAKKTRKTLARAAKYAGRGGIAIFDRYPQTTYAGINDGPKIRENYLKKINNSVLRAYVSHCADVEEKNLRQAVRIVPNAVIKLILPPEESLRRKPEEDINRIIRKNEIIKSLAFENSEVITVDAAQDYDSELAAIRRFIWTCIKK